MVYEFYHTDCAVRENFAYRYLPEVRDEEIAPALFLSSDEAYFILADT